MTEADFTAALCDACGQTTDYACGLDRGTALIVLAIYNAVRIKDLNRVHLRNDMEVRADAYPNFRTMVNDGKMTSNMIGNVLRGKYHGLIAQVDGGGRGEYLITPKGARFLRGARVPRVAVIDKRTHTKLRYLHEDDTTTFGELIQGEAMWEIDHAIGHRIAPESPTPALL